MRLSDPLPLAVPDTWLRPVGCSGLAFCELDPWAVLHLGDHATRRAAHGSGRGLDVDLAHTTQTVFDAQEGDVGKSDHPHQHDA